MNGIPLRPAVEGVSLRVRKARVLRAKGRFSKSPEKVSAYELIECAGLEEAVEVALEYPMATAATIEVRPVPGRLAG